MVKLSNLIQQKATSFKSLEGESIVFSTSWKGFVTGELESSNERNNRNLGGRPTSTASEEEDANIFDVNMDNIMKRFQCFNTIM